ncbi:hypothetical protein ACFSO7_17235 [Bacillus sp. CGMCC 1.16607]|uniref:hypothetical protein n=1 Tax=Bacillus sp. CGMCC 1.16607 TaxID=3351842 RepID=UPI003645BE5A
MCKWRAEDYFKEVYSDMESKRSNIGIANLMNDKQFNLIPENLTSLNRRHD